VISATTTWLTASLEVCSWACTPLCDQPPSGSE